MFAINPPNTPIIGANGRMDPSWYRFFSQVQKLVGGDEIGALQRGPYLTFEVSANLTRAKVVAVSDPVTLDVSPDAVEFGLADSGVDAGGYGSASKVIAVSFDRFGRAVVAQEFDLDTDNILEGAANLFFTPERARESLAEGSGIDYDTATGAIAAQPAGPAPAFTPYPGAAVSNPPTQAEVQGIADGLEAASAALANLIGLLQANGNLT